MSLATPAKRPTEIRMKKKCPCCGERLWKVYEFNPDLFGTPSWNKMSEVCRNDKCHGWYCEYCGEWHPYKTCCAVVMVRNIRSDTDYPEDYDSWMIRRGQ